MDSSYLLVFMLFLPLISGAGHHSLSSNFSGIEFCDGEIFSDSTRETCTAGYTFGPDTPKCLCVRGIYRIYLDNCDMADGFAIETTCTKPYDPSTGAKIFSMQLIHQPNLELTHVVASKIKPNRIWEIRTLGKNETIKYTLQDDNFYTINGKAFITDNEGTGSKQKICVQYATREADDRNSICRIFRADNDLWSSKAAVEMTIQREPCPNNTFELQTHTCFPPLNDEHSECHLTCDKETTISTQPENGNSNCTDDQTVIKHDNEYYNRKLIQYATLRNVKDLSPLEPFKPNKTFELFKKMVQITKLKCPSHFVPHDWIDYVIELFYLLHKGREFKYEEFLNDDQFKWINGILDQCIANAKEVNIIIDPFLSQVIGNEDDYYDYKKHCENDPETAWGYCPEDAGGDSGSTEQPTEAPIETSTDDDDIEVGRSRNPYTGEPGFGLIDWGDMKKQCPRPIKIMPADWKTGLKLTNKHYVPEMAWDVVDLTHGACFAEFEKSYRMFHLVEQAAEKLFTTHIKHLWYNPSFGHEKQYLFGQGADELMQNLEICIGSVYDSVQWNHALSVGTSVVDHLVRLRRPRKELKLRRRKRSAAAKISTAHDIFCSKRQDHFKLPPACFQRTALHIGEGGSNTLEAGGAESGGGAPEATAKPGAPIYDVPQ